MHNTLLPATLQVLPLRIHRPRGTLPSPLAGIVDLRYVARLDIPLPGSSAENGRGAAAASSSSAGGGSSESDSEDEARLERRDTLARGPEARAISECCFGLG